MDTKKTLIINEDFLNKLSSGEIDPTKINLEIPWYFFYLRDRLSKIFIKHEFNKLSYRQINYFDKKGILFRDHEKEGGWRKFNFFDAIWLEVIVCLRTLGYPINFIQRIKKKVSPVVFTYSFKKINLEFTFLELAIMITILSERQLYLIALEDGKHLLVPDYSMINHPFTKDYLQQPHVTIPLAKTIKVLWDRLPAEIRGKDNIVLNEPVYEPLSPAEYSIFDTIRSGYYKEVSVHMKNGEIERFTKKNIEDTTNISEILRNKPYQKIEIIQKDGKIVSIISETSVKP